MGEVATDEVPPASTAAADSAAMPADNSAAAAGDVASAAIAAELLAATDPAYENQSPEAAAEAITGVFSRIEALAAENESLRSALAEERAAHLGLLETNRELEWRVRTGTAASVPATGARQEWEEAEAKLTLLLAENNELESRERQTAEELRRERATTAQLMTSHAEAIAAAQQASRVADMAEAKAAEEASTSKQAADAAREAQALASASDMAMSNLRNELASARAEAQAAHREVAARRHDIEKLHAQLASQSAEEEARRSAARHAQGELERRLTEAHAEVQRGETLLAEARGQVDGHALAAARMKDALELAEAEATRQQTAAVESARVAQLAAQREAELEAQVAELSRRLEGSSEALERQSVAAQRTAKTSATAHATALQEAQEALRREQALSAEREVSLQSVVEDLKMSLEKEARERTRLQQAYDASVAQVSASKAQMAEAAAGGDVTLREAALRANARAEELELECQKLRTQLKDAAEALASEKARAAGASEKVERAESLAHRKVALAEEKRDLMAARLEAAMAASQAAIEEAERTGERRRAEAEAVRAHAAEEVAMLQGNVTALKAQLRDAAEAAGGLQGLLEAQQRAAEAYRAEATRTLAQLSQLESAQQPLQQTLESYRREEVSARRALTEELHEQQAQLQRALSQTLQAQSSESLSDVNRGLEELRAELRSARQREEEQSLALLAARAVVQ